MKIGLERQNTLMIWPSATGARSTSIGDTGRDGRGIRIHLGDQRHQHGSAADGGDSSSGYIEKNRGACAPQKTRSSRLNPLPRLGFPPQAGALEETSSCKGCGADRRRAACSTQNGDFEAFY